MSPCFKKWRHSTAWNIGTWTSRCNDSAAARPRRYIAKGPEEKPNNSERGQKRRQKRGAAFSFVLRLIREWSEEAAQKGRGGRGRSGGERKAAARKRSQRRAEKKKAAHIHRKPEETGAGGQAHISPCFRILWERKVEMRCRNE
jgi:hypothetical protein